MVYDDNEDGDVLFLSSFITFLQHHGSYKYTGEICDRQAQKSNIQMVKRLSCIVFVSFLCHPFF